MKKLLSLVLASSITLGGMSALPVCAAEAAANNAIVSNEETTTQNNVFKILGYANEEALNIVFNPNEMTLSATGKDNSTHWGFGNEEYFRVEIKTGHGFIIFSEGIKGNDSTTELAKKINRFYLVEGDRIYIKHQEAQNRLRVDGAVLNAPSDLSQGMKPLSSTYNRDLSFMVTKNGLIFIG